MGKYFTKYLPAKGAVKKGDKLNSINGELPGSQHVRLFLCSRDSLKIGDVLQARDDSGTFTIEGFNKGNIKGKVTYPNSDITDGAATYSQIERDWLNVIGEVSPEATWVEEGMEFEEGDISLEYYNKFNWQIKAVYDHDLFLSKNEGSSCIAKIKCPTCKTFH